MSDVIEFTRNDDSTWQITVKKGDGTAYPLTGCTLTLRVKAKRTDVDGAALITKTSGDGISVGDATGIVTVTFDRYVDEEDEGDTADLVVDKKYDYDLELITTGTLKFTILRSHFVVLQD